MGWFVLQPITFVFAYFFSLNEKQLWVGWYSNQSHLYLLIFFSLNEKKMWGWFVLKPITHIFESWLIFFDLINKELLNF